MMRSVRTVVLPEPAAAETKRVFSRVSMAESCSVVQLRDMDTSERRMMWEKAYFLPARQTGWAGQFSQG